MKHVSVYLRRLKFPPALLNSWIAKYFTNLRLIILIILAISVFGITSLLGLPRNLYPDVTIPDIIVTAVLPGAGPADVESLVTVPLEDSVNGVNGVKTVTSTSSESVSSVVIEFNTGVDIEKAKQDVQSAVDGITTLPTEVQRPQVLKIDLQKTPVWTFAVTGGDQASLNRFSKRLKEDLTNLPSIDSVTLSGVPDSETQIIVRPEAVSEFNIQPQALMGAIKSGLNSYPSGSVKTLNSNFALTIDQGVSTIDDIRLLKVNLNGQVVNISDIADVVEISKPDSLPVYTENNGKIGRSVTLDVYRVTSVNIEKAQNDAQKLVEQELKQEQGRFQLIDEVNYAKLISEQFSELQKDLVETILLVAVVLFLFLGARQAAVALLATPLTFLITFAVMGATGITLNFLSVFALLLSLGLLVDDTIVVVSAVSAYNRASKFTPFQTGLLVFRDFIAAITTTTATTIWAFLPILTAGGIIGLFIKPIPIVVSTTLAGSFFVAIFITLPFMIFLLKPNFPRRVVVFSRIVAAIAVLIAIFMIFPKNPLLLPQVALFIVLLTVIYLIRKYIVREFKSRSPYQLTTVRRKRLSNYMESGVLSFQAVESAYSRAIHKVLASKTRRRQLIIAVVIFSIFSYMLVPLGFVKNEFFPKSNGDTLNVSVELPAGTNIKTSTEEGVKILKTLEDTPETEYVVLRFGGSQGFAGFGGSASTQNVFNYTLVLTPHNARKLTSSEIADDLRSKFKNYNRGTLSVNEETGGPPAGSDVNFKIFGPDLATLDGYANKVSDFLKTELGATNVQKSIKSGTSKIVFVPDNQKLAQYNLTPDVAGFWLRLFATGVIVDSIRVDKYSKDKEDITLRLESSIPNAEDITSVSIPTISGPVPIASLGKLTLEPNPTQITREDGKRTISVSAGVKAGYTIPQVNANLEKFANNNLNLPSGYSWKTGGVNEQNQESVGDIYKAMFISVILILTTMVLQFHSFRRAIIVILVIPLAISGVFIIFALTGTALSFPALVGVLALFGIVVKNSILIVDRIVANVKTGMDFNESIADAASSRLEPIALTSICAIVGLIPITISDPLWRGLGGAIIAGLTFSGTIMLFFIPVVYYIVFNPKKKR
jgi:multidrug efflux pump subunit AcrB